MLNCCAEISLVRNPLQKCRQSQKSQRWLYAALTELWLEYIATHRQVWTGRSGEKSRCLLTCQLSDE